MIHVKYTFEVIVYFFLINNSKLHFINRFIVDKTGQFH